MPCNDTTADSTRAKSSEPSSVLPELWSELGGRGYWRRSATHCLSVLWGVADFRLLAAHRHWGVCSHPDIRSSMVDRDARNNATADSEPFLMLSSPRHNDHSPFQGDTAQIYDKGPDLLRLFFENSEPKGREGQTKCSCFREPRGTDGSFSAPEPQFCLQIDYLMVISASVCVAACRST